MKNWSKNIIYTDATVKKALEILDKIGVASNVLFVVNSNNILLGSVTDGDIRRGLLNDAHVSDSITSVMNKNCLTLINNNYNTEFIKACKKKEITIIPVVDDDGKMLDILNLTEYKAVLPVTVVIMAGGKGERLMPLTKDTPKPMLKIGDKPILEHNIDRLIMYGIRHFHICVNYLSDKIVSYFGNGEEKGVKIEYVYEPEALGTIGSVSEIDHYSQEYVLVMNSDLLTNIDFNDFFDEFISNNADAAVASIPYRIDLPYAILEVDGNKIVSLKEKPKYTYFANAGIYLIKKEVLLKAIPQKTFFNATDLIEYLIKKKYKVVNYTILEYWLDIGRHEDFERAQNDIKHISL
ncbi:MAG: nucleotidyltransferase family protein [Chitinophagaceae bacterium]|nr:nucleotidyltransferase family protein [Chitinophagaceae bacterium]